MAAESTNPHELLAVPLASAHPSLPGRDYHVQEIYELERERIFYNKWICVGREEEVPDAGDFVVREIMDESIVVVRDGKGSLNAFYNVCRHRGSRLCDSERGNAKGGIRCPYHAWTYTLDGRLRGTPNVEEGPGFSKADFPLYSVVLESWSGFVFVNLAADPKPFSEQVQPYVSRFDHYRLDRLRVGHSIRYEVAANWKIVVENWNECLHCPAVHPELVEIIPLYTGGSSVEDDGDWGNRMGPGLNTITRTGRSKLPPLPNLSDEDKAIYHGYTFFPNLIVNLSSDHAMSYRMEVVSPERTIVYSDFLFEESTVSARDFDPSEVVEFWDLVSRQDWAVCERTQKGVKSRAFEAGILTSKDAYVYEFNRVYLSERDGA
jgi:Rieske 2Fe-2S family protein